MVSSSLFDCRRLYSSRTASMTPASLSYMYKVLHKCSGGRVVSLPYMWPQSSLLLKSSSMHAACMLGGGDEGLSSKTKPQLVLAC